MKTHINKKDAGPLYVKIFRLLKNQIEEGKLKNGEILPSEYQLADDFGVSRVTIRQAFLKLQQQKYIKRKRSYGTEVTFSPEIKRDEKAIAVLLVDITRPFFAEILKGIQVEFDKHGYKLILCDTENIDEKEKNYLERYKNLVAGFIIAPATGNQNHAYYGELLAEKIPFVFIDRYLPEFNVDAVVSDNIQGGYLATKHLLELGHRKIALLCEPEATSLVERIEGCKKALSEYEVPLDERFIFCGEKRGFQNGYHLIKEVIKSYPEITAAFCMNDDIGWGTLKGLSELNIKIPEDFAVIGFDNLPFTLQLHPPLATVDQQKYKMGENAAEILINRIEGKTKVKGEIIFLPVELIVRESTAKVKSRVLVGK